MKVNLALPREERVPSWAVTSEQLAGWGFPVEVRGHCVGVQHVLVEGTSFGEALHAAWSAGFVEQVSLPDHVRVQQAAERAEKAAIQAERQAEVLAWARENIARRS